MKKGKKRNGEKFTIKKVISAVNEDSPTPYTINFKKVKSYGLRICKHETRRKFYSFSLLLDDQTENKEILKKKNYQLLPKGGKG